MNLEKMKQIAKPFLDEEEYFYGSKKALKDLREARRILKLIDNDITLYAEELQQKTGLEMVDVLPRLIRDLPEIIRQNKVKEENAKKSIISNAQLIKMNIKDSK